MPEWDARLYLKFASERTQPSVDLAARVALDAPRTIVDAGCGPGNSTMVLRQRWPSANVVGLDHSETMVDAARREHPDGVWVRADIETWQPSSPVDLVFSNAALQWVPHHDEVLPRLLSFVAPGGALAVQMPARVDSPVRRALEATAGLPRWAARMAHARRALTVESPGFYYDCLRPRCSRLVIWQTTYVHVLDGSADIVAWFRGTGLRPYLDPLEPDERAEFAAAFGAALDVVYRPQADGKVLFQFPRLFFIAYR